MGNQNNAPKDGPAPKTSTAPPTEKQKAIKIQRTMNVLDKQIKTLEDKQKKAQVQVDTLKAKAKQLVGLGKKNDARKYLQQAARISKNTENFTARRKVLQSKKFQLDQAMMDKDVVGALGQAQQHLKQNEHINEKLEEIILDTNQQKMIQEQLNDKMKQIAQDDELDEDIDNLMAELQAENKNEIAKKIPQKQVNTNATVNKQKQKQQQDDEISKMMAEL